MISHLPINLSQAVPAYLHLGSYNLLPDSHEQVAVFRHWADKYGANIAAYLALPGSDIMDVVVDRPPTTIDDALALAQEQYAFCPSVLLNYDLDGLPALAEKLLNSSIWHFWWG